MYEPAAISPEPTGVHSAMPEQAPRKARRDNAGLDAPGIGVLGLIGSWAPGALLLALSLALALPVLAQLLASLADLGEVSLTDLFLRRARLMLLARSLLVAGGIGLLSVALAIPMARVLVARLTRRGAVLAALLICPIWLPTFMIYAAGNLLRAPDTMIGRAIIEFSTSSPDRRWVTIWLGYAVAVLGLALWSAPLSAVLIAAGLGHRSSLYDDMLALEPLGRPARARFWLSMNRKPLISAWALVAIVMLGSAVPIHLAQLDTWSIVVWRELTERPPSAWGAVWISAIPVLLAGAIGGLLLSRAALREPPPDDPGMSRHVASRATRLLALLVWGLAVPLPLIAMLLSLRDPRAIGHFWRLQAGAMRDSGLLALATGAAALLVALLVAFALSHPSRGPRRLAAWCVTLLCVLGLIPGVLVGAAVARQGFFGASGGWPAALLASCVRTSFIGAIVGALCAASEPRDRRAARLQMGGDSFRAWAIAVLPTIALPLLGALLISAVYALHEIEASVMVRPPGMDNLPQQLLSDLHYARLEELSAAGVNLLLLGLVVSLLGSFLLTIPFRTRPGGN